MAYTPRNTPRLALITVRIALVAFTGVDLADISKITFKHNVKSSGAVLTTDLAFTDGSWTAGPGRCGEWKNPPARPGDLRGTAGYSPSVPTRRRNFAVVLGTLVAVGAVVVGATAATNGQADQPDQSAADQSGRSISPAAEPGPGEVQAPASLFDEVPAPPDAARDAAVAEQPGTLVAQGADLRVESVQLAAPTTVEVDGETREVTSVYRVTITAGPYVMRDLPAIISIDATPIGVAAESVDLSSLVLFTYDDAVISDGATVGLSYGLPSQSPIDWSTTLEVVQ